jgi:hypothetical protein
MANQQMDVEVNLDTTPILYTDSVYMTTNPDGVILDFTQRLGSTNKMRIVSRIGMSREHAKKMLSELGKLLAVTEGKGTTEERN